MSIMVYVSAAGRGEVGSAFQNWNFSVNACPQCDSFDENQQKLKKCAKLCNILKK